MKKLVFLASFMMAFLCLNAQETEKKDFQFTTIKENPITSIKNQNRSGTCWAYSSLAFFESELLRMGKGEYNFAEMYLAHKTYQDRAKASVRMHGDISFSQGGSFYDCVYCMKHYGIVPETAMPLPGTPYGDSLANFNELFKILEGYVNGIAKGEQKKLSPIWNKSLVSTLDNYLGECPQTFTYNGKTYTPQTYLESTGLNMDDYISLTSFTHHPFYSQFIIEVQDNWRWGLSYNLPIDEFMEVMDYAIRNGYTFAWGSDVSEKGFTRNGIAVNPDTKTQDLSGSDMAHWLGMTESNTSEASMDLKEVEVTQELRQEGYDNWETTDDHGMLIYGLAKDPTGKEYFMVKNSWGTNNKYKGTWYASKSFVAHKTMNILINKNALPKKIAKKLGL